MQTRGPDCTSTPQAQLGEHGPAPCGQPPLHWCAASSGTCARAALQQVQSNPRLLPRALSGRAWRWYCVRAPAAPPAAAPASLNRVTGRREWRPSETRPVLWRASIRPAGACAGGSGGPRARARARGTAAARTGARYQHRPLHWWAASSPPVGSLLSTRGPVPVVGSLLSTDGQPPLHRCTTSSRQVGSLLSTGGQPPLHRWAVSSPPVHSLLSTSAQPPPIGSLVEAEHLSRGGG